MMGCYGGRVGVEIAHLFWDNGAGWARSAAGFVFTLCAGLHRLGLCHGKESGLMGKQQSELCMLEHDFKVIFAVDK